MLLVLLVLSAQCLLTITRYNGSLAALREAVGVEASRALFLERIEKWARAVAPPCRKHKTDMAGQHGPRAAHWPRLAGAWGGLRRDLALREASGEPAGLHG